jgi:hypothetical protein
MESTQFAGKPTRDGHPRGRFESLTLLYLLLPGLIFLLTWLRPWAGVLVAAVVAASFFLYLRGDASARARPRLSGKDWIYVLGAALLWTAFSGIGGCVWQVSDYEKHNLAFHDLLTQSWPVRYATGGQGMYLCYGLGYYLTPALVARVLGAGWLPAASFLWGGLGLALFCYWVSTVGGSPKKTLTITLLFSTTEALWHMFLRLLHSPALHGSGADINGSLERLGTRADYSDTLMSLQFRPQHVIVAWLGTALFYEMFWVRRNPRGAGLVWAACWLWSPLASVGLLLIPLAAFRRWRWRDAIEPVNAGSLALLAVVAIYFQGHVPLTEKGPIWKFSHGGEWLLMYPGFVLLELGPVFLLYLADRKYRFLDDLRPLFRACVVVLVLLPLYKIGYYGDLRLQAQTCALLIAGLAASRCFSSVNFSLRRPLFALLAASQLLGGAYPFARWCQEAFSGSIRTDYSYEATRQIYGYQNLSDFKRDGNDYAGQYLGRTNSIAGRWLLRPQ